MAKIMTKSWVSTLGREEFLGKMICSRVPGTMQNKNETFSGMQGFVSGLNEPPNPIFFFLWFENLFLLYL